MADPGSGFGGPDSDSQAAGAAMGGASASDNSDFDGGANERGPDTPGQDRGLFGGIADFLSENPQSVLGLVPGFGLVTAIPSIAQALGFELGPPGPVGPGPEGDGPITPTVGEIQQTTGPTFNPIEDMVGSEYVAYGGVGADQLRKQLFPYMNFNQPAQPGVTGLMGQYAGVGQGTGLMTGPFGMSNTQV